MAELVYRGHSSGAEAVAWSPDGKQVASSNFGGGDEGGVHVWDASTGMRITRYPNANPPIAWSPDGQWIAADNQGPIVIFDANTGQDRAGYRPQVYHVLKAYSLSWSPDGKRVVSGGGDGIVEIWDSATGAPVFTLQGRTGNHVETLAWSPDGSLIATGDMSGVVRVWNSQFAAFAGNSPHVRGVTSIPKEYRGHANSVLALAWSPDGDQIASAGGLTTATTGDNSVQVWRASDTTRLFTATGHAGPVYTVTWSPDGQRIASGSYDSTVRVLDAQSGQLIFTYREHQGLVLAVAWSPDSQRIVSASSGRAGDVRIWIPV